MKVYILANNGYFSISEDALDEVDTGGVTPNWSRACSNLELTVHTALHANHYVPTVHTEEEEEKFVSGLKGT